MKSLSFSLLLLVFLPNFLLAQDSLATEIEQFIDNLVGTWVAESQDLEMKVSDFPPDLKVLEIRQEITRLEGGIGVKIANTAKGELKGDTIASTNYFIISCACDRPNKTIFGMSYDEGSFLAEIIGRFESGRLYLTLTSVDGVPRGNLFSTFELGEDGKTYTEHEFIVRHEAVVRDGTAKYTKIK